jgi:hypothetical protein
MRERVAALVAQSWRVLLVGAASCLGVAAATTVLGWDSIAGAAGTLAWITALAGSAIGLASGVGTRGAAR